MDAPDYKQLLSGLAPALAGPFKLDHVIFSAPTIAFDYPVTELTILNLKTPENRVALVELLSGIAAATENLIVFGPTRNDENRFFVLGGWESVQVRECALLARTNGLIGHAYRHTGQLNRGHNLKRHLKDCTLLLARSTYTMQS